MSLGDHKQVLTHKDRIFVNKNKNVYHINNQLLATRDTRVKWFMVNRSVNTSVNHRSYAKVLQSCCKNDSAISQKNFYKCIPNKVNSSIVSHTVHSNVDCVPTKCVPAERNSGNVTTDCKVPTSEHNAVSQGKAYLQDFSLPMQNRYDVLQTVVHKELQYLPQQHGIHLDKPLEGNKDKNGKKLGKNPCDNYTPDATHSTTSRGNENKTRKKLGQVTQELLHLDPIDHSMHHITDSKGNKNGPRAKLGEVQYKSANSDQSCTENQSQRALTHNVLAQAPNISDISTGHDLACLEEEYNDNYVYLYDVSCSPVRRKRNIPEYIYRNKFSSQDYVKCVQQNGKDFGFLPLNDLMLYTVDDITWTNIPSIVKAHTIVRNSGKPNFMGARIPLASQFNINAWKFYLAQYWDNQIVDLLQYGFPLDFDRSGLLQKYLYQSFFCFKVSRPCTKIY